MGQQSSGKSTIAKILSFCSWLEKDISFHQSYEKYLDNILFTEKLETFHKMKGYFKDTSEIIYVGDAIKIKYTKKAVLIEWLDSRFDYTRSKISYIPSERSTVILPEMEKVELPNNYLRSFLYDWFDTRKMYTADSNFEVLDLGIKYYYSEDNKESHIYSDDFDILLSQASSGIHSVIPLLTMVDNLINNIYSQENQSSYELDEVKANVIQLMITEFIFKEYYGKDFQGDERKEKIKEINKKISEKDEQIVSLFSRFKKVRNNLFKTHRTNLIIEEPEQNLFPSTQKELVYKLFEYLNSDLKHSLTFTTHSPYVLYAINNCILAFITDDRIPTQLKSKLSCLNSKINPKEISVYELSNGKISCIQQENGLIGDNFFDKKMKEVMDDFYLMLNFVQVD
ncbi:ATP-binding protein [Tenacibaculum finnmarkense]|uniref:ATP-binding protein n=1 Tax=Tenacibaculum finnmarkense TaxID=2781243 RepID=UPI001EFA8B62|nr:ATP-binding protein [Tenacibaculum finnmarkense]MCG8894734.1 ATP-binding protein [Tenacibaculum finnmarkense]MCG8902801.1 ATP-binding protein [Tenacibaculum finnmarkense]